MNTYKAYEKPLSADSDKGLQIEKELKRQILIDKCVESVKAFSLDTTIHGMLNVVKSPFRIIWLFLLNVCIIYSIMSVYQSIDNYYAYSVDSKSEMIFESPSEFPAITICNMNAFNFANTRTSTTYLYNILNLNRMTDKAIIPTGDEYSIGKVSKASATLKAWVTADQVLTSEQRASLGFSIDSMLLSCFYDGELCNSSHFTRMRWSNEYGNCYTFNSLWDNEGRVQKPRLTSKPGIRNGLTLELFTGVFNSSAKYSVESGVVVAVHERGKFPLLTFDTITASNGLATNIAVKKIGFNKLAYPYSTCRKNPHKLHPTDSIYHKATLNISLYSQRVCYGICLQELIIKPSCNCADPAIPMVSQREIYCYTKAQLDCVQRMRDSHYSLKSLQNTCGTSCPKECNYHEFTKSVSISNYPTDYYAAVMSEQKWVIDKVAAMTSIATAPGYKIGNYTYLPVRPQQPQQTQVPKQNEIKNVVIQSLLLIKVYMSKQSYLLVSERPKISEETLIGLAGGYISFCVGASVLSMFEILEMLVCLGRNFYNYLRS